MIYNTPIVIVAGMGAKTRAIGNKNGLLWHVPDDMRRFKELTVGKPVIMGRKTFESILVILGKPLPGRTNIIITRNSDYKFEGATTATNLEEALEIASRENPTEIHIGGGAEIYKQALPYVDRLHITHFFDEATGDTTFPVFEGEFEIKNESDIREYNGLKYQWIDYARK